MSFILGFHVISTHVLQTSFVQKLHKFQIVCPLKNIYSEPNGLVLVHIGTLVRYRLNTKENKLIPNFSFSSDFDDF
jgi:hypothetical protein